ncbi:MAG: hypothetical protein H7174_09780 [Flavobacterium sp.]|nr:hypothetical protein [Flavobacterium sp.]
MKNIFGILLFLFLTVSCQQKIVATDINKLNGYWEIEKVVLPDNDNKDYKINETIDFFEINNNIGFRHKVTPQFNGKYLVNEFAENVKIVQNQDKTYLEYSTKFAKWKDELISISDDKLVVKNDANIEYHYKKPIPFSVK